MSAWLTKLQSLSALHCSGLVADTGCRFIISGGVAATAASNCAMRGSVV
jgi:hypothetical protein